MLGGCQVNSRCLVVNPLDYPEESTFYWPLLVHHLTRRHAVSCPVTTFFECGLLESPFECVDLRITVVRELRPTEVQYLSTLPPPRDFKELKLGSGIRSLMWETRIGGNWHNFKLEETLKG